MLIVPRSLAGKTDTYDTCMGGTAIGELPGLGKIPEALITAEGAMLAPLWTIGMSSTYLH